MLGKLVTLDEYFSTTRETDDWTTFNPREYPSLPIAPDAVNAISTQVDAYRSAVRATHQQLGAGLIATAGLKRAGEEATAAESVVAINAWSFASSRFVGADPLTFDKLPTDKKCGENGSVLLDVLGCGYAALSATPGPLPVAIASGLALRNERLEVTVSKKSGGIQSLRLHRDRSTRMSQRLVFHRHGEDQASGSRMVADRAAVTRNDELIGEITSSGRILDANNKLLAKFTQRSENRAGNIARSRRRRTRAATTAGR